MVPAFLKLETSGVYGEVRRAWDKQVWLLHPGASGQGGSGDSDGEREESLRDDASTDLAYAKFSSFLGAFSHQTHTPSTTLTSTKLTRTSSASYSPDRDNHIRHFVFPHHGPSTYKTIGPSSNEL